MILVQDGREHEFGSGHFARSHGLTDCPRVTEVPAKLGHAQSRFCKQRLDIATDGVSNPIQVAELLLRKTAAFSGRADASPELSFGERH
jgi:hypothetical protein